MNDVVRQASEHRAFAAPLLWKPAMDADYDGLVALPDDVTARSEGASDHPAAGLASAMGDPIEAYDDEHRPSPPVSDAEALRHLMRERETGPADLKEIGEAGLVSDLSGDRVPMDLGHARALAAHFPPPVSVYLED